MRDIENILQDAKIVEPADTNGVVAFGSTVTLVDGSGERRNLDDRWATGGQRPPGEDFERVSGWRRRCWVNALARSVNVETPGGETVFTIKDVT